MSYSISNLGNDLTFKPPCVVELLAVGGHAQLGSTRELAPGSWVAEGLDGEPRYDPKTDLFWRIDYYRGAVDFEIRRPDSDPILFSQLWKMESEQKAQDGGWATSIEVAGELGTRNLTRPDREVTIDGRSNWNLGDLIIYWDGELQCHFHHFFGRDNVVGFSRKQPR